MTTQTSSPRTAFDAAQAAGDDAADLAAARKVLTTESAALVRLADTLDGTLSRAIDILMATTGRVIVTGMGKSGHVGAKIAATLASTGTPAFFVHPSEASHGDLGMITPRDCVIALSNSGGTTELSDIVAYARRFSVPVIAITGGKTSPLAEQANLTLLLPETAEACPMGLAPTTSTTMMLALGDALAIAALGRRGFSADDYKVLHPGGSLGAKLIKVQEIMHKGVEMPLVPPGTLMAEAILTMTQKRFGIVGVRDDGGLLTGVVTDGDLRRHMGDDLLTRTVDDIMTVDPRCIRPQALAAEAVGYMNANTITVLFVTDEAGRPEGILHIHDALRAGVA